MPVCLRKNRGHSPVTDLKAISSVLDERRAGILLHITSLPGGPRGGTLGQEAHRFVEFLAATGVSVWQTLPLGPTHSDRSPYQCLSSHAGNPSLIDLDWLVARGWLTMPKDGDRWTSPEDYHARCLREAHNGFQWAAGYAERRAYRDFVAAHNDWLDDFACYMALRRRYGGESWQAWPKPMRDRHRAAMNEVKAVLKDSIEQSKFEQFVFFTQWRELRACAQRNGVVLFGDMPIFVAADSADVWAGRDNFALDHQGRPLVVAGVPPDYFSATGQLWGNPQYDWARMQADGFSWWLDRLKTHLELFDWIRIDHFRGFESYWEIPAGAETAIHGRWIKAPGEALLGTVHEQLGALPLVAEDLGVITPAVEALRDRFNLPGMKILQFAFDGGAGNAYLPHNHQVNSVVYTGTHDNDTTLSWYQSLPDYERQYVTDYLGQPHSEMPWALLRCALASVARLAILPMQDILGLGAGHRMNTPGTVADNWQWRFSWDQLTDETTARITHLVKLYGRNPRKPGPN
jgi:4-alpha-glucanotransferase